MGSKKSKSNSRTGTDIITDMKAVKSEQRPLSSKRTPSVAYRVGETDAINRVLAEVEYQGEKRVRAGFNEITFTGGVLNCFLMVYVFGAFPQHFWILYLIEASVLFPLKTMHLVKNKPLNQIYYYFDFCWIMNFIGVVVMLILVMTSSSNIISEQVRKELFLSFFGISCGPILGACIVLSFIAVIFHDVVSMTSVFIHIYPPILLYVLRWNAQEVRDAWPRIFDLDYEKEIQFFSSDRFLGTVFGNTLMLYMIWFVPYVIWQLFIGLDLPRSTRKTLLKDGTPAPTKYDTVYHSNLRDGMYVLAGDLLWNRDKETSLQHIATNDFELRDFYVYMGGHLLMSILSMIVLAYLCFLSKYVHGTILICLVILCTYRGAKRYTYYSTQMYSNVIRKNFADEILREDYGSVDDSSTAAATTSGVKTDA